MVSAGQPAALAGEHADWLARLEQNISAKTWSINLQSIADKLMENQALTLEDGMVLYNHSDLHELGALAHCVREARFGSQAFFNSNVHINQTNICVLACKFCAFRRGPKASDAYAMSVEQYLADLEQYAHAVDEVHSVGGLHPDWGVEHYEGLFRATKEQFPHISIKALTAVEIKHLAQKSSISTKEVLR